MAPFASPSPPELVLYARDGCHLCDEARDAINVVLAERSAAGRANPPVREVDIATDPALEEAYGQRIPVVTLGETRIELLVTARRLARLLEGVLNGVPAN